MDYAHRKPSSILARGAIVRTAVGGSILLVIGMTLLLWQRWSTVKEPTSAIIVAGDESTSTAKISVLELPDDEGANPGERIETGLSKSRGYREVIYRYPGRYKVIVKVPPATDPLMDVTVTIDRARGSVISLPTVLKIIGEPGDRVNLTDSVGGMRAYDLNMDNHYSTAINIFPGKYTLVRLHGGAEISREEIQIEPHTPQAIRLRSLEQR